VFWYGLAANQGDVYGQYGLGAMYRNGYGVAQDDVMAYMWTSLAAQYGLPIAVKDLDTLTARMSPAQIDQARSLAIAWVQRARGKAR
jgi:hypothetical protein